MTFYSKYSIKASSTFLPLKFIFTLSDYVFFNRDKLKEAERIKDNLIKQKEERLAESDLFLTQAGQESFHKQLEDMDNERKALADLNVKITEQLTRLEQENVNLKSMTETSISKGDLRRVEMEKKSLEEDVDRWKRQYDQLEKRHHELLKEKSKSVPSDSDINKLRSQIKLLESSKKRVEEELEVLKRTRYIYLYRAMQISILYVY